MKYIMVLICLTGCASPELIFKQYQPTKGGTVRYYRQSTRDEAVKLAGDYCGGKFNMVSEGHPDMITEYTHINFTCSN
jgi:hypothetical protein